MNKLNTSLLPLLTALTAIGSISVSMYLPSLPSLAFALHATAASIKLSLTAFLFVFAFAQLVYGPLSDRFGRRFLMRSASGSPMKKIEPIVKGAVHVELSSRCR